MDKKKSKLMGVVDDDEPKEPCSSSLVDLKKEIRIERTVNLGEFFFIQIVVSHNVNRAQTFPCKSYLSPFGTSGGKNHSKIFFFHFSLLCSSHYQWIRQFADSWRIGWNY